MTIPFSHKKEMNYNLVYRIKKLIYVLKQFLRVWYEKLSSHILSYNFIVKNTDHLLFSKIISNTTIIVYFI
jgi:hypothetical protein